MSSTDGVMMNKGAAALHLQMEVEQWSMTEPFHITGYTFTDIGVLVVSLHQDGVVGRGEASGVYYHHETPALMCEQIEACREQIEAGVTRDQLLELLPAGGARNAIDCALWDLEAKRSGRPAWQRAGLAAIEPLVTTFTVGADAPEVMAEGARAYTDASALKLKLTDDGLNAERVRAVRAACPDIWMMVDANQGFTRESFACLLPVLVEADVALVEQPFPVGEEAWLDDLHSPIRIAADESVQDHADLPGLVGRVQAINIKLDKCGGLTEALAMVAQARELGLDLMVGNMCGTSLAMAPGYVLGQLCDIVDLDGPVSLKRDRELAARYVDGRIWCPDSLWGGPISAAA